MKKNLILLAIAAIGLSSCGGGMKQGPGGMLYNIHEDKSGPTLKEGDFAAVNVIAKTEGDSLLTSTYESGMPAALFLRAPQAKGDVMAALALLSEGDSATVKVNIDSTSQKGAPKPPFKGKYVIYQLKVVKVITKGNLTDAVFNDRCKAYYSDVVANVKKREPAKIEKFVAANNLKVTKTASGLNYYVTAPTTGATPAAGDTAVVNYTGKIMGQTKFFETSVKEIAMTDKKTFNPTRPYGPIRVAVGTHGVIAGWDEGLMLMHKGEKVTLIIPSDLAYGEQGMMPVIPPFSTLIFDMELVDIVKPNPNAKPAVAPMPMPAQAQMPVK